MNDDSDGPTYRQAEESEMHQWIEEQDAKRRMRVLETLHEMSIGLDDGQDTDEEFMQSLESRFPTLLGWPGRSQEKK